MGPLSEAKLYAANKQVLGCCFSRVFWFDEDKVGSEAEVESTRARALERGVCVVS